MPSTPFTPTDPAEAAQRVRAALRAGAALSGHPGTELAARVDAAAADLAGVAPVTAGDPVDVLVGVLAAWLAGATPWVGPDAPAGAALPADALVVAEPLVGCVAHPAGWLGGLALPEGAERVVVHADWRVDAWLPVVCSALLAGVPEVELVAAGSAVDGRGVLAFPGHAVPRAPTVSTGGSPGARSGPPAARPRTGTASATTSSSPTSTRRPRGRARAGGSRAATACSTRRAGRSRTTRGAGSASRACCPSSPRPRPSWSPPIGPSGRG
ncbi:hypothetical protein ACFQV2_17825 [Actinokineospora soli]|uniref:Aldehyde dehydrogenase family protein n=1 Tax=Actinokineospora soli TaxID=1048753 RepID=A0ABW2TMT8_9PSEU